MRQAVLALFVILLVGVAGNAAAQNQKPCALPEFREFDFWVGEWDLTWGDTGQGENVITVELDSCVIVENFTTAGESPFVGRSVSTYDVKSGQWKQTWVDNAGGYLDFVGGMVGDSMILQRQAVDTAGNTFHQRMVFFNIEKNSLDWHWERSTDGTTWKTLWAIHYERRE